LRTPEVRLPSGVPKEEFGWMIFEKKTSVGNPNGNVQSTPLAAARGGEAWRRNVRYIRESFDSTFMQAKVRLSCSIRRPSLLYVYLHTYIYAYIHTYMHM